MKQLDQDSNKIEINVPAPANCRVYRRRWFILTLFFVYIISSSMQWIQYSVIADVVVKYYNVSYTAVDWSSIIYMLLYIPFSFPGNYLLDKLGLRKSILIGMLGTCIGSWIKVASVDPNRYWVVLLGQGVVAIFQVFVLPVPPKLAAVWFGENEVSSACSIGVLAIQMGGVVGFLVPPLIVKQGDNDIIEAGLYTISLVFAVFTTILLPILYFYFSDAPPTPPSIAQSQIQKNSYNFTSTLKNIGSNPSYLILIFSCGVNLGLFYTISILLNQIILKYYPDAAEHVGMIGMVMICFTMFGSVVSGVVLDKFHRFKETTFLFYFFYLASTIAFTLLINKSLVCAYIIGAFLGFFINGILTVGFELAVEITYPEPEGRIGGFLTTSAQIFGIVFTYLYSYLFNSVSKMWANIAMCIILILADIFIIFIKFDLKRSAVKMKENHIQIISKD